MTLSEMILQYRTEHRLSQRKFAEMSGMTNGYISMLENNSNPKTGKPIIPTLDTVKKIATAMGMSVQELLDCIEDVDIDISKPIVRNVITPSEILTHKVRIVSHIAAGEPVLAEDEWEMIDAPIKADYALTVEGDFMLPTYMSGDIVYIRAVDDVDDGRTAAVLLDDEATLKHVYHIQNGVQLVSNNPKYPPMIRTFDDCNTIRILGVVVGYTRMYKGGYED